ncbi:MAG: tetratricopeptide repeat protein, partial [Hyphomicrobiaceae bacterium]
MKNQARAVTRMVLGLTIASLLLSASMIRPVWARGEERAVETYSLFGSYLAARFARNEHDATTAATYFRTALQKDPGNLSLFEQAMMMAATEGQMQSAVELARKLTEKSKDHRMARLIMGLEAVKNGRYAEAEKLFAIDGNGIMEHLTLSLARAWAEVGVGHLKKAINEADKVNQAAWATAYVGYHKAMMYDVAKKPEKATAAYERIYRSSRMSFRVALAYAHHESAIGNNKRALTILGDYTRKTGTAAHPVAKDL